MHSRKRDFERKLEELEDRMSTMAEESDTHSRKNERLTRENQDLKRQVDTFLSKRPFMGALSLNVLHICVVQFDLQIHAPACHFMPRLAHPRVSWDDALRLFVAVAPQT